tara:strand:+ start:4738 stop:4998 length:261 start_codon:yes stop_codon:yes gene_type:complete
MINNIKIEHNSSDVEHLQWLHSLTNYHMDMDNRKVTVISGSGWKFQFEGESAIDMTAGLEISIPKNKSHKIIKGTTDLVVTIETNL